jgi:NAD(P)-dependent dehydrogenase (short-subunit alcohol dehydrogenase family)
VATDSIEEISTDQFDETFKTNVSPMFWICKAVVPHLKPGATIINTASIQGYQPSAGLLELCFHKGRDRRIQ